MNVVKSFLEIENNVRYTYDVTSKNTREIYLAYSREMDYATSIVETFRPPPRLFFSPPSLFFPLKFREEHQRAAGESTDDIMVVKSVCVMHDRAQKNSTAGEVC